jgi:FkbM family methyltransferase
MKRPQAGQIVYSLAAKLIAVLLLPLRDRTKVYVRARLAGELVPVAETKTAHGKIKFLCPALLPFLRSAMTKEPETNAWIDGMERDAVFWDVGANIGAYALYAAAKGMRVCAFEPEASNYYVLSSNVDLNGFNGRVTALNLALSSWNGLGAFKVSSAEIGQSGHELMKKSETDRSVLAYSARHLIDELGLPRPHYLKVDVDGSELDVVRGLDLADAHLREAQIELRQNGDAPEIYTLFAAAGFGAQPSLAGMNKTGVTNVNFKR